MDSTSPNLFFHLFEVNYISKGRGTIMDLFLFIVSKIKSFTSTQRAGRISRRTISWFPPFPLLMLNSMLFWTLVQNQSHVPTGGDDSGPWTTSQKRLKIILLCMKPLMTRRSPWKRLCFLSLNLRYIVGLLLRQGMLKKGGNFWYPLYSYFICGMWTCIGSKKEHGKDVA